MASLLDEVRMAEDAREEEEEEEGEAATAAVAATGEGDGEKLVACVMFVWRGGVCV